MTSTPTLQRVAGKDAILKAYNQQALANKAVWPRRRRAAKTAGSPGAVPGVGDTTEAESLRSEPARHTRSANPMSPAELVLRQDQELQRANALARQLAALRHQMMDARGMPSEELQRLQARHRLHLDRCLRLRSRLDLLAQAGHRGVVGFALPATAEVALSPAR